LASIGRTGGETGSCTPSFSPTSYYTDVQRDGEAPHGQLRLHHRRCPQQADGTLPPAEILTQAIPAGRLGAAVDVAAVCWFLCSEGAGYVTGQIIQRPVAVVTGASRGAGAGIAHALGAHGCTVYVTGRTVETGGTAPGTIGETAAKVTAAGGEGIPVRVDHGDDEQVAAFFERVAREQGRIDILVNNAAIIRDEMMGRTRFWEEPIDVIDTLDVGLRSSYVATVYAAPLMVPHRKGLVAFTSSSGAVHYAFGPAYGVPKAGVDKMAADMAYDFREVGVAAVSIWMGSLLTDRVRGIIASNPKKFGHILHTAETPELTGHVIWELYRDPDVMAVSGQTVIGAELAVKYGIKDEGDRQPPSYRDLFDVHPPVQCAHVMR
jgi:NAD(P)-dependent dehydrogenase (short-subunit alcohol dehydrogenase family)